MTSSQFLHSIFQWLGHARMFPPWDNTYEVESPNYSQNAQPLSCCLCHRTGFLSSALLRFGQIRVLHNEVVLQAAIPVLHFTSFWAHFNLHSSSGENLSFKCN